MKGLVIAALLLIAACTTGEKVADLREGMTPDQVREVIGDPDGFQRVGDFVGFQYVNRLISGWSYDRADYYAIFENDRLTQWGAGQVRQGTGPNVSTLVVLP